MIIILNLIYTYILSKNQISALNKSHSVTFTTTGQIDWQKQEQLLQANKFTLTLTTNTLTKAIFLGIFHRNWQKFQKISTIIQNHIQFDQLINHKHLPYLKIAIENDILDIFWSRKFLKYDPFDRPTCVNLLKRFSHCIKHVTTPNFRILHRN